MKNTTTRQTKYPVLPFSAVQEVWPTQAEREQEYHVDNAFSTDDLINRIQRGAYIAALN